MKKIFFLFSFIFVSFTCFSQKLSVDYFTVNESGVATCYMSDGSTRNIRAIINPEIDQYGRARNGRLNGQALMLSAPIKPGTWETDTHGNTVPVNFNYNIGFDAYTATAYVVEGTRSTDGKMVYNGREQQGAWGTSLNPADWVRQYKVGSYEIPNFCLPVNISKTTDGRYTIR